MKNILLHIDTLDNYSGEQLERMKSFLGEGRKKLVDELPPGIHRDQRILASDLLERELLRFGIQPPAEYSYSESGRPYLRETPELSFSISHSGKLVGVALFLDAESRLSEGTGIGLDLETLQGRRESTERLRKVAERFFRPEENRLLEERLSDGLHFSWEEKDLEESDEEQFRRRFFRIWTYKEAMCKALDRPLLEVMKEVPYVLPEAADGADAGSRKDSDRTDAGEQKNSDYLCRTGRGSVLTLTVPGIPLFPEDILFSGSFIPRDASN